MRINNWEAPDTRKATWKSTLLKNMSKDKDNIFLVMFSSNKSWTAIEKGEGMTHWCGPQLITAREIWLPRSLYPLIRKDEIIQTSLVVANTKIKELDHTVEGGRHLRNRTSSPTQEQTSTVYWCIASKLKAPWNFYWMSNMFLWVEIFLFFVCYHVVPKRHSQLDYELNGL